MNGLIAALPPGALETFAALLLAHCLADFTFQTNWMVAQKRNPLVLLLHVLLVLIFSTAALGGVWEVALLVAAAHFVIDAVKVWLLPQRLRESFTAFYWDQVAHLATLVLAAAWWPLAVQQGSWAEWRALLTMPAFIASGLILTVWAGGFAVGLLTRRFTEAIPDDSLPAAGRLIGQLERGLILLLVLIEEPSGIGFLIAAKSVLRFDPTPHSRKVSEYVIIGTLASFGWALAVSYATLTLVKAAMPPLLP